MRTREDIRGEKNPAKRLEVRLKISLALKGKKKNYIVWNKGKNIQLNTGKTHFRTGHDAPKEQNSPLWKGESVGYQGLHKWVREKLGKPKTCSACEMEVLGQGIHWANKSHEYKRNLDDWIRLCAKCHRAYDTGNLILA